MTTVSMMGKKCPACAHFQLTADDKTGRCVICSLWVEDLHFSDADAGSATLLLIDLQQARHPTQKDWRIWKGAAEGLIARCSESEIDALEWLKETLQQYEQCCLCERHLPKSCKSPTCDTHDAWFTALSRRCPRSLPDGMSHVSIARDTAPDWKVLASDNLSTKDTTAWDLFMKEVVIPRISAAWDHASNFGNSGGNGAGEVPKPVPSPTPPSAPPEPPTAEEETRPLQLPVLKRERTGAEGGWIRRYKDAITEQLGSPPTEQELNSILAHREAWVFAQTDRRGQAARATYVVYLAQGLQEILQMIKAARGGKPAVPPELPRESPVTAPEPAPVPKPSYPPPAPAPAPEAAPPLKVVAVQEQAPPPVSPVPAMPAEFEQRLSVITARSILTRRVIAIAVADLQELDRDLANLERDIERFKEGTTTTPPTGVSA